MRTPPATFSDEGLASGAGADAVPGGDLLDARGACPLGVGAVRPVARPPRRCGAHGIEHRRARWPVAARHLQRQAQRPVREGGAESLADEVRREAGQLLLLAQGRSPLPEPQRHREVDAQRPVRELAMP